jgi:TFIIF-interacting CTD phosphatase-like protein
VRHVKKVLDTLERENLYIKFSKCEFGKTTLVYLGHIVGGGQLKIDRGTWDEHVRHVKKVLDTLQRENLYVKFSKCEFGKTTLVYLGHIVGGGQLKIDPSNIHVIVNWPEPKSVTEIQGFLGEFQY